MMGGAIKARVEELTAPTNEMKRSSLGIAAAKATVKKREILYQHTNFFKE